MNNNKNYFVKNSSIMITNINDIDDKNFLNEIKKVPNSIIFSIFKITFPLLFCFLFDYYNDNSIWSANKKN
jgi:hypothetical protein